MKYNIIKKDNEREREKKIDKENENLMKIFDDIDINQKKIQKI